MRKKNPMLLLVCLAGLLLCFPLAANAQKVTVRIEQGTLDQAFQQIIKQSNIQLVYTTDQAKNVKVGACYFEKMSVDEILTTLLSQTPFTYRVNNHIYTIVPKAPQQRSQTGNLQGKVVDENGDPVIGASVVLKGTTKGTITNADGLFEIPGVQGPKATVVVSFVGLQTQEQSMGLNALALIHMKEDATMTEEVVVTGYQDISKAKSTGSVVTLRSNTMEERYTPNIMTNLEGRVAGLSTYGGNINIRGTSSLYAETSPLLVVDGMPIEASIEDLNPYDIESINVLKDAAASAIYGARASNGIIVITTKNANKKGKIDIDFSTNITMYEKKNMNYSDNFYMTPEQQVDAESDYWNYYYLDNDGEVSNAISSTYSNIEGGTSDISPIQYAYYQLAQGEISQSALDQKLAALRKNNFAKEYGKEILRRQVLQQYNLAIRSRSEKSTQSLTLNYKHDNSGQINTNASSVNINYKGTYDIAKWLTATVNINGILDKSREPGEDYNSYHTNVWYHPAYMSMYEEDGSPHLFYYSYNGNAYWSGQEGIEDMGVNIKDEFYNNVQDTHRQHMRYHANLLFKPLKGLTVNAQFIYETDHKTVEWYANQESHVARSIRNAYATYDYTSGRVVYQTPETGGMLRTTNTDGQYWTARGQIDYNRTFGKHSIVALAGLEFHETQTKGSKALMLGYDEQLQNSSTQSVDFGTLSQINYSDYLFASGGGYGYPAYQFIFDPYFSDGMGVVVEELHRYASGYFNATYTYNEKYNVFGSFRKDYADVYGLNAKYRGKPLWSIGAGWNIHNEEFMKSIDWIEFLKLRFSYGVTGNIYQGATSYMTATSTGNNQYTNQPYGEVESPANPNLKWEQSRTTNVGLDFSVWRNRLHGSIDFYNKVGKDIFSNKTLDPTTGYTSMFVNAASLRNRGVELAVTGDWFTESRSRKRVGWSTSFTFSYNKNIITDVENPSTKAWELIETPYKKGYPVSAMWSYRFAGMNDTDEPGTMQWYGDDGAKQHHPMSASVDVLEYSGQSDPKVIMGMDNRLTWNGLSLSILMAYYGGHKMRALVENETFGGSYGYFPITAIASYFLNAWTPENPTNTPGIGRYGTTSTSSVPDNGNIFVRPAAFLKIRNIVIGYDLPEAWLRGLGINRVTLRFQVDNPKYLWVKNKVSVDPETLGIRDPSAYVFGINLNI